MKRFLSLILALVLVFSFAACSSNETSDVTSVNSIDNNESVSSEEVTESEASESESEVISEESEDGTIEITTENWQDYFELGYDLDVDYKDDEVTIESYTLHPSIFIKDGYKVANEEDQVELVFDAKYEWRYVFFNKSELTYEIGGICDEHDPDPNKEVDAALHYYEEFEDPNFTERYYCWLDSFVTYSGSYTENTSNIPDEELFYYLTKEEDGVQKFKVKIFQLPVITITEASGKISPR